ncbi:MAG: S8 family serine peptidase, partial [Pseudomonadota bacterium]
LVKSRQAANTLLVNAANRGYQLTEQSDLEGLDLIMLNFQRPDGISGIVAIREMKALEPSATAGVEHFYSLQTASGKQGPMQYAKELLAWPDQGCVARMPIGIIDGAIDTAHAPLQGRNIIVKDFTNGTAGAIKHGTAVAEILVGPGQLQDARLYSAFVVSGEYGGSGVHEIIRAIDWMVQSNAKIVNFSMAGPYNMLLDQAIQRAAEKGTVLVAAVGNDGPAAPPLYPAALKEVIAVTAIDSSQNVYRRAVRGDHVDFAAPGVDIFVSDQASGRYESGTSLAVPHVTAMIATDPANARSTTAKAVRDRLAAESVDLGEMGRDPVFGLGLPRANASCRFDN